MINSGYKFIIGAIFIVLIGFANEEAGANDAAGGRKYILCKE